MSDFNHKHEKVLAGLVFLQDAASRSSQLTNGMVNILTSFDERLARLEKTILPVYNETKNLQQKQENIDKTLASLDHVISYYSVSKEVEPVIKESPSNQGLEIFLQSLGRLQEAMHFFEKNNPQSVELENVMSLFETGKDNIISEFKENLAKHSQTIPAIAVLEALANDEEEININHFSADVKDNLMQIADWLVTHNEDDFMNVYARFRANTVQKTLLGLRDHLRSSSTGAMGYQGVSPVAPMSGTSTLMAKSGLKASYDTPSRKTSKKIQQMLERKANQMLLRASQTLESSTGLALGSRRSAADIIKEDVVEEHEIESFLTEFTALLRLLQSELRLMLGIVPLPHQKAVLSIILRDALEMICHDAESLSGRARRSVSRQEFGPVLLLFPALRHLVCFKGDCDKLLEGCDSSVRTRFYAMVNNLHTTCGKALEDFAESVRSESAAPLPRDGTVYEMTSNVVLFLGQLTDLSDTVGPLLAQDQSYSNALVHTQPWPKPQRNKALLGLYIKKVLVQLNLTLVTKSDAYNDSSLRYIFRLNNSHYLLSALKRSGLLDLLKVVEPECESIYREMINEQKRLYSQSWNKVLAPIWNSEDVPASVLLSGRLREKDKALIKEKFSTLNKEFEELSREQRGYSVPDVELRESLKRDNKEYILPKYQAFFDKYSNAQFSKHSEKYIKYSPAQISSVIDTFFDVAA
uniref:Exocyst complex component 7 n=1 Tax=Daphnia galeata TaxID=27404 RepID=A0A8J2RS98_9CRUS|nr:unnamed protein product [Daphnia galeata]